MEGHALSCPIETSQTAVEAGVSPARDLELQPKRLPHKDRLAIIKLEALEGPGLS